MSLFKEKRFHFYSYLSFLIFSFPLFIFLIYKILTGPVNVSLTGIIYIFVIVTSIFLYSIVFYGSINRLRYLKPGVEHLTIKKIRENDLINILEKTFENNNMNFKIKSKTSSNKLESILFKKPTLIIELPNQNLKLFIIKGRVSKIFSTKIYEIWELVLSKNRDIDIKRYKKIKNIISEDIEEFIIEP